MIKTTDEAVAAVRALNQMRCGARPSYAEFIYACEAAVAEGRLIEVRESPTARREFWVSELAPENRQAS